MSSPILPGSKRSAELPDVGIAPWQAEEQWEQVKLFFQASIPGDPYISRIEQLVSSIITHMKDIDKTLQELCLASCPKCNDNCCIRATVWYDFRDLVFFYSREKGLPPAQITKNKNGCCCHLAENGCTVPRPDRPFVCTWYLCSSQKQLLTQCADRVKSCNTTRKIAKIQVMRKELEDIFCQSLIALR